MISLWRLSSKYYVQDRAGVCAGWSEDAMPSQAILYQFLCGVVPKLRVSLDPIRTNKIQYILYQYVKCDTISNNMVLDVTPLT